MKQRVEGSTRSLQEIMGQDKSPETVMRVQADEESSQEPERHVTPEEVEEYKQQAQEMLDSYRDFFVTFAKDVSLRFVVSDAFYINLSKGEIHTDVSWFIERGYTPEQFLWANLHELAHFIDMSQDPEKSLENFDYIRKKAKKTGGLILKRWQDVVGQDDPDFIDRIRHRPSGSATDSNEVMSGVERVAYKIHHSFYNALDDIYVNNVVSRRAPRFERDAAGGSEVEQLYREKLFPVVDYREKPRHVQFMDALLRNEMVPTEQVEVDDEIEGVLNTRIIFRGRRYTPKEIVDLFLKPRGGRNTNPGERYRIIQKTLEPIFEKLLRKDLKEWDPKKPAEQDKQEGQGDGGKPQSADPFDDSSQQSEQSNPDQFSEAEIREWLEQKAEEAEKTEEAEEVESVEKSEEEKAQESQEKMDREWCAKNEIEWETFEEYRAIEKKVEPYLDELSRLWQRIVYGSSMEAQRSLEGHYKTGVELDVARAIEEWPKIERLQLDDVRIMKRSVETEHLVQVPELIRIRMVGDISGSMTKERIKILQQVYVLINSSLQELNTYLNLAGGTESRLKADSEGWVFGSYTEKIKSQRGDRKLDEERVEVIRSVSKIQTDPYSQTRDDVALEAIINSLSRDEIEAIQQKKAMEIVIEVTDGGSSSPFRARDAVDALLMRGVIVRAFQIGTTDIYEKENFNSVWNSGREQALGEYVGADLDNLIPAVARVLKEYLHDVQS